MVVLSAKILPKLRLTVDEFLLADLPEGRRYELVNGVVEVSAIPGPLHDYAVVKLQEALLLYRARRPDAFAHISQRAALVVPRTGTVRQPDLALYRTFQAATNPLLWKKERPFWVAEATSPRHERRDLEEKRIDYWRAGVREYWILHRRQRRVLVLVRGERGWNEQVYESRETARSVTLPGFTLPVDSLYAHP